MHRIFTPRRQKALGFGIMLLVVSALVAYVARESDVAGFTVVLEIAALALAVAAGGCAAYVGASIANEDHHELEQDRTGRVWRRRQATLEGTNVRPNDVVAVIRAGAASPTEVAEVLGVYTYVARRMCAAAVDGGDVLEAADGRLTATVPAGEHKRGTGQPKAAR